MKIPEGKQRELAPDGTHAAICVEFIDFGTQPGNGKDKSGKEFAPSRRGQAGFELTGQKTEEGDPILVYKEYTLSNNKKAGLMKDIMKWFNLKYEQAKEVDVEDLLQKVASVTVQHVTSKTSGNTYAKTSDVGAMTGVKGMKAGKHVQPLRYLSLEPSEFDQEVFDNLPEWMRVKIAQSPEYADAVSKKNKKPAAGKKNKK